MKYSRRRLLLPLVLLASIFLFVGCTLESGAGVSEPKDGISTEEPQTPQNNTDESNADCEAMKEELKATQAKYEELQSEYSDLSTKYDGLSADYDKVSTDYNKLSTDYNELNADFDELRAEYNAATQGTAGLAVGDVEQAIFKLINQDRQNNGLNELEWSDGIHQWAKVHSDDMATRKTVEPSVESYWQDVLQAAGYSTLDRMANATMIIWRDRPQYERNFLNEAANYGAIGVSKSGDIFYITYFAHTYK